MNDVLQVQLDGVPHTLRAGERLAKPAAAPTYRDAPASDVGALIARIRAGEGWRDVMRDAYADSRPWLHRIVTDEARALFFRQHPPPPGARVLDVGAGWGQATLPLAREHAVVAVEPTAERLDFIAAVAAQENLSERIHFIEADFLTLQFAPEFDYVTCIGVLEWVPQFRPGEPRPLQLAFLRALRAALRPGGECIVAIENRLGLKYLLGAPDDHTGLAHLSIFDAAIADALHRAQTNRPLRAFTYAFTEYASLFAEAGFARCDSFAAFPDYKLPSHILAIDDPANVNRMASTGSLPPEHDGTNGAALAQQPAITAQYRALGEQGLAHFFAPSYFFRLS